VLDLGYPRDVVRCFFTFPLAICALASVPSERGWSRCSFDLPAMPILSIAGE
jgi:hypothetical protein